MFDADSLQRFLNHPLTQRLASNRAWSVSTKDKMPIDVGALKTTGRIYGCSPSKAGALATLPDLLKVLSHPANLAYLLDFSRDALCVLDIEPSCPQPLRDQLCATQHLWAERSLSGKGLHLVCDASALAELPQFDDYRHSPKIQSRKRTHELLLTHWVTFTGDQVTLPLSTRDVSEVFLELSRDVPPSRRIAVSDHGADLEDYPGRRELADKVLSVMAILPPLDEDKYDNDLSRYDFAYCCHLTAVLMSLPEARSLTQSQMVSALALVAPKVIPHRPKHDQFRLGEPWLVYTLRKAVAAKHTNAPSLDHISLALMATTIPASSTSILPPMEAQR